MSKKIKKQKKTKKPLSKAGKLSLRTDWDHKATTEKEFMKEVSKKIANGDSFSFGVGLDELF